MNDEIRATSSFIVIHRLFSSFGGFQLVIYRHLRSSGCGVATSAIRATSSDPKHRSIGTKMAHTEALRANAGRISHLEHNKNIVKRKLRP